MKTAFHIIILLFLFFSIRLYANESDELKVIFDDIQYTLHSNNTATVSKCPNVVKIIIADTIWVNDIPFTVTNIAEKAFASCHILEYLILPHTLSTIYTKSFEQTKLYKKKQNWDRNGCLYINQYLIAIRPEKSRRTYMISDSTRLIATGAFIGCDKIRKLILPEGFKIIAPDNFMGCSSLKEIQIPSTVTKIGEHAFDETAIYTNEKNWQDGVLYADSCAVGTNKNIPNSITIRNGTILMADKLFADRKKLKSVSFPASLRIVSDYAFYNCSSLLNVTMSDSVKYIGNYAFLGCSRLNLLSLPSMLTDLGIAAFYECKKMKINNLPQNVTSIPKACFYQCISIDSICLAPYLQNIGEGAFYNCSQLKYVNFPSSLREIGEGCFYACISLKEIDLSICDALTIESFSFKRCYSLHRVILPNKIFLGQDVFAFDHNLESVIIVDP